MSEQRWIGRSKHGYGWWIWLGPRIRWTSGKAWTPTWPKVMRTGDEHCNDVVTAILWPIGGVEVWWRLRQRVAADGPCEQCLADPDFVALLRIETEDAS